jgi:hypothetical protein
VESIEDPRADDDLLLATADGDAEAFAVFYRRHVGEVLGFLSRRTDTMQELVAMMAPIGAAEHEMQRAKP